MGGFSARLALATLTGHKEATAVQGGDQKDIHKHHNCRYVQQRPVGFHQQRRASSLAQVPSMLPAPPAENRKRWRQGESVAPHTHAPAKTKTPTENKRSKGTQKKQKGPRLGLHGQNPKQGTRTTGKPGLGSPRATTPNSTKQPRPCRRKGPRR